MFFVTDGDVLRQIDLNDAAIAEVAAAIVALGTTFPAASLAGWNADVDHWKAWSAGARARLSGGFWGGEWFGVPAEGNAAMAWKRKLDAWRSIVQAISKGEPALLLPETVSTVSVSDENTAGIIHGATSALGEATGAFTAPIAWAAVGLGFAGIVALFVLKRR